MLDHQKHPEMKPMTVDKTRLARLKARYADKQKKDVIINNLPLYSFKISANAKSRQSNPYSAVSVDSPNKQRRTTGLTTKIKNIDNDKSGDKELPSIFDITPYITRHNGDSRNAYGSTMYD